MNTLIIVVTCIIASANGYGFQRPTNPSPAESPQVPQKPIESWTGGFHSLKPWTAPESSVQAASSNSQSVSAPNVYFPTEQAAASSTIHKNPIGATHNVQQHSRANQHTAPSPAQLATPPAQTPNQYPATSTQAPKPHVSSPTKAPKQYPPTSTQAPVKKVTPPAQAPAQYPAPSTQAPNQHPSPPAQAPNHHSSPPVLAPVQYPTPSTQASNQHPSSPTQAPAQYPKPSTKAPNQNPSSPTQAPAQYPNPSTKAPNQHAAPSTQASHYSGSMTANVFPQKWNLTETAPSNNQSPQQEPATYGNKSPQKPALSGYQSSEQQAGKGSSSHLSKESSKTTPNTQGTAQSTPLAGNNYQKTTKTEASVSTSASVQSETTSGYQIPSSDSQQAKQELPSPAGVNHQMQNNAGTSHSKPQGYGNSNRPAVSDVTASSATEQVKAPKKYPMEKQPVAANTQKQSGADKPQQVTTPATNGYKTASDHSTTKAANIPTTTQSTLLSTSYYDQHSKQTGSTIATSYDSKLTQLPSKNEESTDKYHYDNGPQAPLNLYVIDSVTTLPSADVTSSAALTTEVSSIQTYSNAPVESASYTASASQSSTTSEEISSQQTQSAGFQNYFPPLIQSPSTPNDSGAPAGYGIYQSTNANGQNTQVSATASATVSQTGPQSTQGAPDIYQVTASASGSAISEVFGNYFQSPPTGVSGNGASITQSLQSQHQDTAVGTSASSHNHQAISQGSSSNGNNGDHGKPSVAIITSESILNKDGSFSYNFESEDGIKVEASGLQKQVGPNSEDVGTVSKGSYSYLAPDGVEISVTWVADEKGFQPVGDHLPTPPPLPSHVVQLLAGLSANKEQAVDGNLPLSSNVAELVTYSGAASYSGQAAEEDHPLPSDDAQPVTTSGTYSEQPAKQDQSSHAY